MLGPRASDLIEEAVIPMDFGDSAEDLAKTIQPHPTFGEALRETVLGIDGRMIHIQP